MWNTTPPTNRSPSSPASQLRWRASAALGLDRAALFVYDEEARALVGASAIGPHDAAEAELVRVDTALHERTLEQRIVDHAASEVDTRFEAFVRTLEERGVPATVRMRRGIDIDAGCGQLKSSAEQGLVQVEG